MLKPKHFSHTVEGVLLNEEGKKIFIQKWEERLQVTIMHKKLNRQVSYRTLIRLELYKLQKHFMEEQEYKPFISAW